MELLFDTYTRCDAGDVNLHLGEFRFTQMGNGSDSGIVFLLFFVDNLRESRNTLNLVHMEDRACEYQSIPIAKLRF